ncbi:MAG: PorT family protein [Odoribacteraceae bacterium]|jgi:hypothetical protein|nr:PorT family protein [Odoribacteraceae bacterium]
MKKIILLIVCGLAGMTTMAQGTDFGVHVGWNNAKIDIKEYNVKSHSGFMAGAFLRVKLPLLYLEPALNFVYKKCEVERPSIAKEMMDYSSVDIPLVLGFNIINVKLLKVRGFVGPELSLLMNKLKLKDIPDMKSDRVIWNGKVGGGVDVGNLCLDIDYSFGLKNAGGSAKKARACTLTLGFKIF